jgi:hypothetical protein
MIYWLSSWTSPAAPTPRRRYKPLSSGLGPLVIIVGDVPDAHPSVAFLFRPWAMPSLFDWAIMSGLGLVWAGGMYCVARAYSVALASVVAPFEYIALPINVMWGFVIWRELPPLPTWAGAALTMLSGMYILYRERKERSARAAFSRENTMTINNHSTRPGGHVGFVGVTHGVELPGEELFFAEVHLHGGPAPVRRFLPELVDLIWNRKINPGKVFDLTLPLDQVAEGYRAMDERRAIKALLLP